MMTVLSLDLQILKALASERRIEILKCLDQRRMTLSELSGMLDLAPPTVLKHLEHLTAAGLVALKEDGHRWKYYELTDPGLAVMRASPDLKVVILLSFAGAAAMVAGICAGCLYFILPGSDGGVPFQDGQWSPDLCVISLVLLLLSIVLWFFAMVGWRRTLAEVELV